jgi:hypothetical protein
VELGNEQLGQQVRFGLDCLACQADQNHGALLKQSRDV